MIFTKFPSLFASFYTGKCINKQGLVLPNTCECFEGYQGDLCETNINDCTPDSCHGNGDCIDGVNTFTCQCYHGYTGDSCQERVCTEGYCQNGGTCTKLGNGECSDK